MSKPITRLYYYEEETGTHTYWHLTDDRELAESESDFRTANLDDVDDFGCVGGFFKGKIIHVDDGFFEWCDTIGDYECVDNLKDRVLDRLEEKGMENSEIYECIVGWKDYKIHSFMDNNDYSDLLG